MMDIRIVHVVTLQIAPVCADVRGAYLPTAVVDAGAPQTPIVRGQGDVIQKRVNVSASRKRVVQVNIGIKSCVNVGKFIQNAVTMQIVKENWGRGGSVLR